MRKIIFQTLMLGCFLAAMTYFAFAASAMGYPHTPYETKVQWSDVPLAVQKTVTANAEDGHPVGIKKIVKNEKVTYRVEVETPDGERIVLKITDSGKLLELRYEDDDEDDSILNPTR